MNRIFVRSILLCLLVAFIILIFFRVRSPFGKNNTSFAPDPKKEITRIELLQNGKKLILSKNEDEWFVNGKSEARKSGVTFMLRILNEIRIKSPVSSQLFEDEITGKKIDPVRVRIYENRKNIRSFLVFKTRSNIYGNVMKMKEYSKPFIVHVPGFEGDIGSAFTLNELFWEPYTVFNLLPSEISLVKFEDISDTSASFSIENRNHHYILSDSGTGSGWDSARVIRYVSYFAYVPFESWSDMNQADQRSIQDTQPLYRITILNTNGKKVTLTLWAMVTESNGTKQTDSDRLYGKTDERDGLFIIRYFDIDPLIKKIEFFFDGNY